MVYNKEAQKRYAQKYPERRREVHRRWRAKNKKRFTELMKKYYWRNKEKCIARVQARKVKIPDGTVCEICKDKKAHERHHKDYSKALEVMFVCKQCHEKI